MKLHLIFDADDTLWENNVVFERITSDFVALLSGPDGDEHEVRRAVEDVQRAFCEAHGYGTKVFIGALHESLRRLAAREPREEELARIRQLVEPLAWKELQIIEGVRETLSELHARHDLMLLTKGDPAEQQWKIDISGLGPFFRRTFIVREKDAATYRSLVAAEGLDAARTWMIGNSPRSDILPALRAGLRAAYVPHPHTWAFERRALPSDQAVLHIHRFPALLEHF